MSCCSVFCEDMMAYFELKIELRYIITSLDFFQNITLLFSVSRRWLINFVRCKALHCFSTSFRRCLEVNITAFCNNSYVNVVEHRLFQISEARMSATSFLLTSFHQTISAVRFLNPLSSFALPSCRPLVMTVCEMRDKTACVFCARFRFRWDEINDVQRETLKEKTLEMIDQVCLLTLLGFQWPFSPRKINDCLYHLMYTSKCKGSATTHY